MRAEPEGPGGPFSLLFDEAQKTPSLPEGFRAIYGGDWRLREPTNRPYLYVNFAVSRDGRVSFNEPGRLGGGDVSGFHPHDTWLMGLLRARADAVMVGDNTLRLEPNHLWTSAFICPADAPAFRALRLLEGRNPEPLQVFLSLTGEVDTNAAVFQQEGLRVLVATTERGAARTSFSSCAACVDVVPLGKAVCDLARLTAVLYTDYGVRTLLCEGGPRVYGSVLAAGLVDDEFLTLCPTMIGGDAPAKPRPSLVEGHAFRPEDAPASRLVSLRRAGDYLFLHSHYGAV